MKKISIVTPTFNQGQFIEQTIDSVLSQNYPNLEYIIMDGGSTDNTLDIIRKYEKYISYWESTKDNGQSHAINKGLQKSTGEIFNWLNSDDWYAENTLHRVASLFEDNTTTAVSGISNIWKQGNIVQQSSGTDVHEILAKTIGGARIDQPETFFSRTALQKMGLLNEQLHYVMDREWWIRYLLYFGQNSIQKTRETWVNFRIHDESKTHTSQTKFKQETWNLYYSIAVHYQLKEAAVFEQTFPATTIDLFNLPEKADMLLVQKSIHYFWYFQGCQCYAQNEYKVAQQFFRLVNPDLLVEKDKKEMEKIRFKMKMLPVFLKKIWNKR
ncbi:MAG: glycosyltransferase family 2 protein [Chitinophagales bacterium]